MRAQSQKITLLLSFLMLCLLAYPQIEQSTSNLIRFSKVKGAMTLAANGKAVPIVVSEKEFPGVIRVTKLFQEDIFQVTSVKPEIVFGKLPKSETVIIAGTIGKNALIDQLVASGKLNVSDLKGKWETSLIQVVEKPFPGVKQALVIAGSDKRGTIFGMFELSRQMGVSPWHFWSDVPAKKHSELYIRKARVISGEPKVKYRGIFLNDEEPALGRWAVKNYGGFNHQFYEKVFELILRLKGNYLWPAMWWASFNTDDPINPELAEEMGIVMSTTHHEPMMRAHAEWKIKKGAAWNYETNKDSLQKFWKEGIERMKNHESIVSMGMRGDGDMAMTAETNIALLERIVADQRSIIENVTGKPASETPQLWALYKEVQDYYDNGMRVPDDVTLLLCDDNWGNIRKLPSPEDKPRAGGYGIYYHFDYVGGPRNYKWLNTSPLPAVWEQMHNAYEHGVDRIWLVNVGDLKPMELPISFFLDYAWNPDEWPKERLPEYTKNWAAEQFGNEYAPEIARMLDLYTKYNGRRKPELLSPKTYSLTNFREAERIVEDYNKLAEEATLLNEKIPVQAKDAFYQLVLHPVTACANLNELYLAVAKNRQAAEQGRATANYWAEKARQLYQRDADITDYYHTKLANGKWDHMMAQTHIGYTYWQQPEKNAMPEVKEIGLPELAEMGVSIEGSAEFCTEGIFPVALPELDAISKQAVYIDLFNRGKLSFDFQISADQSWLKAEPASGKIEKEQRIWLSADWSKVPEGKHEVLITISQSGGKNTIVKVPVFNPELKSFTGFVESNGFVSIEAEHFSRNISANDVKWEVIPGLGRTLSGMKPFPVTAKPQIPAKNSPCLEYDIYLFQAGKVDVSLYLSPTLNYFNDGGTEVAVSFDDQEPVILNMNKNNQERIWESWVSNNINQVVSSHQVNESGKHTLKVWMVDPGAVLQKIVVRTGKEKPSYLGEPESTIVKGLVKK
ncbi:MAG TPA: glycosyl hydrolase [Prolixibacteraceae bacterium]|nr:glycosyl hydrolase [Prolixibacteraceae bacterium]